MDTVLLTRLHKDTEQGVDGKIYLPNGVVLFTGEDPDLANASGLSCVDPGDYETSWIASTPKHPSGVFQLQDKNGRTSVEIHIGNYFGNKSLGWATDVEGCIILGTALGILTPNPDKYPYVTQPVRSQKALIGSTLAYQKFLNTMGTATFLLRIVEQYEETPSGSAA